MRADESNASPAPSEIPPVPSATYRLQFHAGFTLRQAIGLVPYLHDLGISHVYASPLLMACPGSTHGYDVCDFSRINPEIGTEAELIELAGELRQRKMGLVLDIVPNHAGIAARENHWWQDVLERGPASPFASHFDIDWNSPDPRLRGKVLVPVLGDEYDRVLERGELQVVNEHGALALRYYDHRFPLSLDSAATLDDRDNAALRALNANHSALNALIEKQHYRLAFWRRGDAALNYRRFFSITTLAGLRVEDDHVFKDVHARIRDWLQRGLLDGLRVDHPDGLRDPAQYLQHLRQLAPDAWIVVEKILERGEALPTAWPIAGTTGYDFLNRVNGLFVDPAGERALTEFYAQFTGGPTDYATVLREKKRMVLRELLAAEVNRLAGLLRQITNRTPDVSELTEDSLREAIVELAAAFPVYRTYARVESWQIANADHEQIEEAVSAVRQSSVKPDVQSLEFVASLLRLKLRGDLESEFVMRFQQLTGPAMAKGAEDTAFYCFNRFVSLNEVGGDPGHFGLSVETFHQACLDQQTHWPTTMLASSTHDTKRSEDVRARLNVLSEMPAEWAETVKRWSTRNERHRRHGFPDRNAEYLFYQTLVGAWPLSVDRALAYMEKATCEAKQHTNWTQRNPKYDQALRAFITAALTDEAFVRDLERFVTSLIPLGHVNSLAQALLKLTAPGVPDTYQGTEFWDFSLVDPDNRRPVDFATRAKTLQSLKQQMGGSPSPLLARALCQQSEDGKVKLFMTHQALQSRRRHPKLFESGNYLPLTVSGEKQDHVYAFSREGQSERIIVVVPRLVWRLTRGQPAWPVGDPTWKDTRILLSDGPLTTGFRNVFTGEKLRLEGAKSEAGLTLARILAEFPVALLESTA